MRAETNPNLLPTLNPLDLTVFQQPAPTPCPEQSPPGIVKTALTICHTRLTDPSLWWAKQLYGDTVVDNWIAYIGSPDEPGRVDVVVNSQVWNTWNYLERYAFVDRFGAAAQRQGFNVRVFDWQSRFLAAYTCDFGRLSPANLLPPNLAEAGDIMADRLRVDPVAHPPLACQVLLNPSGRSALRGRSPLSPNGNP
ncbi:hypothetical protein [Trichothermofontia sp.]